MARTKGEPGGIKAAGGFTNWLNGKLRPYIGPPPLGPFNEEPLPPTAQAPCPICGNVMSEHIVDRSGERTQLHCPKKTPAAPAA
ncbi:hypothetical protein [Mycetocola spongiae]|uniref:hypothetical protein n=1 Tax=Mycetocola spongiae TaxID=2859226 RepID=UPI001CF58321|nr:hypothetical protein [Mycetocola spongiae]UCR88100.1 hypothetical protein KXZ72_08805 [Mycetocola spongiae]